MQPERLIVPQQPLSDMFVGAPFFSHLHFVAEAVRHESRRGERFIPFFPLGDRESMLFRPVRPG